MIKLITVVGSALILGLTFCAAQAVLSDSSRYARATQVETVKMKNHINKKDSIDRARDSILQKKFRDQDSTDRAIIQPLITLLNKNHNKAAASFLRSNAGYGTELVTKITTFKILPYFCGTCKEPDSLVDIGDTCLAIYRKQYIQYVVIPELSYVQSRVGYPPVKTYRIITFFKNPNTSVWVAEDTCTTTLVLTDKINGYYGCK